MQSAINRCNHILETYTEQNRSIWIIPLFLPLTLELRFHYIANALHSTIQDFARRLQSIAQICINIVAFRTANRIHALLQTTVDVLQDRLLDPRG